MGESNIEFLEDKLYEAWLKAGIKALEEGGSCPPNPLPDYVRRG